MSGAGESPRGAPHVVLLHGLLSSPQEFGLIALTLRNRGLDLVVPEIAGYTAGDRRQPRRWQQWLTAAEAAIDAAVPSGQPMILGGLCSGGLLAAAAALRGGRQVQGLVLMSPTFAYDGWAQNHWRHWRGLGYALGLARWISIAEREPFGVKNPKVRRWIARQMHERAQSAAGPARLPLWGIREVESLARHVRDGLTALQVPALVLHAREDEICTLNSVQRSLAGAAPGRVELQVMDDSYHMITMDNDRHRVMDALTGFARQFRTEPLPATP